MSDEEAWVARSCHECFFFVAVVVVVVVFVFFCFLL